MVNYVLAVVSLFLAIVIAVELYLVCARECRQRRITTRLKRDVREALLVGPVVSLGHYKAVLRLYEELDQLPSTLNFCEDSLYFYTAVRQAVTDELLYVIDIVYSPTDSKSAFACRLSMRSKIGYEEEITYAVSSVDVPQSKRNKFDLRLDDDRGMAVVTS